jgi:hypothetical protein
MSKIDDGYAECELEAFWDGLEHRSEAMRAEMDRGPGWRAEDLAEINESIRFDDYMALWGDLDPTASGFKNRRREGA